MKDLFRRRRDTHIQRKHPGKDVNKQLRGYYWDEATLSRRSRKLMKRDYRCHEGNHIGHGTHGLGHEVFNVNKRIY